MCSLLSVSIFQGSLTVSKWSGGAHLGVTRMFWSYGVVSAATSPAILWRSVRVRVIKIRDDLWEPETWNSGTSSHLGSHLSKSEPVTRVCLQFFTLPEKRFSSWPHHCCWGETGSERAEKWQPSKTPWSQNPQDPRPFGYKAKHINHLYYPHKITISIRY